MLFFLAIVTGVVLFVMGWRGNRKNRRTVVVTGKVVSVRMEVERRYLRRFLFGKYDYGEHVTQFGGNMVSGWYGHPVTVYKPIVRFSYLDGEREAVVQDSSEYKPELNVSMQIAFFPENPAKAWRPSKESLWSDGLIFLGGLMLLVGVLGLLGFVPFLADEALEQASAEW